jgi:hypothetical protein
LGVKGLNIYKEIGSGVPEIAGEDGARAIENAGERAHECRERCGQLKAFEAAREELENEFRVGAIRAPKLRVAHFYTILADTCHFFCTQRNKVMYCIHP